MPKTYRLKLRLDLDKDGTCSYSLYGGPDKDHQPLLARGERSSPDEALRKLAEALEEASGETLDDSR